MDRVLAYHIVFTCYGFWLPNDPRGSGSTYVGSRALHRVGGDATGLRDRRRSVAAKEHDPVVCRIAKEELKHAPVLFTTAQVSAVTEGFRRYQQTTGEVFHALAVLPNHVHAVVLARSRPHEDIRQGMKAKATHALKAAGLHPMPLEDGARHTPWGEHGWGRFLHSNRRIDESIDYVRKNLIEARLFPQNHDWIVSFTGTAK